MWSGRRGKAIIGAAELLLGQVAVVTLQLLLGSELQTVVGRLAATLAVLAALVAARGSKVKSSPQPYSPPTGPVEREQHPRWEGAYWVRTAHAWYRLLEPDAAYVSLWNATDGARLRVRLAG